MKLVCIHTLDELDRVKADWEAVYRADPQAQVFLSWAWLRGWFETSAQPWFVLGARPDAVSPFVAFLPLRLHPLKKCGIRLGYELQMGGTPGADYTGFVCLPEYQDQVLAQFAMQIMTQHRWDRFLIRDVLDARMDAFAGYFEETGCEVEALGQEACPFVALPEAWDTFAQDGMGKWTRRDVNRFFRRIEGKDGLQLVHTHTGNVDAQLDAALGLWQQRWGADAQALRQKRAVFRRCLADNLLWLAVVWDHDKPVGALAAFADAHKKVFAAYLSAYDEAYAKMSIGKGLCGYGLRYAIENGFEVFDFLRGNADYKFLFGAQKRFNQTTVIRRNNWRLKLGRLLKRCGLGALKTSVG